MFIEGILATLVSTSTVVSVGTATVSIAGSTPHAPEEEVLPKKLAVGTNGYFQPGALLQGWFWLRDPGDMNMTFRVRRAEVRFSGEIVPDLVGYLAVADFARVLDAQDGTNRSPLQDLSITLKSDYADVSIGQFKIPISWEGYNSSSKVLFPERALVSTTYGDRRDIGLKVTKTFEHGKKRPVFSYFAGIYNGSGQNNLDPNNSKDLTFRAEVFPGAIGAAGSDIDTIFKGLMIGGAVLSTVGKTEETGARERYELDARIERSGIIAQVEYIRAHDRGADAKEIVGHGYYLALAVRPVDSFQFGMRYGRLDPDRTLDVDPATSGNRDEVSHTEAMVTYFFESFEARLQATFGQFDYDQRADLLEAILAAQVSY